MKTKLSHILCALVLSLGSFKTFAEEIAVPVISRPALLEEGTQRSLSQAQINELLPWAKNSKITLSELIKDINDEDNKMSVDDKIHHLSNGIVKVVTESKPDTEMLMRYVLNRSLVLVETLNKEADEKAVGFSDTKLRILTNSVKLAINYYNVDLKAITNKKPIAFADFGATYFTFLLDLNKSVFDASAQFEFHKMTIEWLAWDLYRDFDNKAYAAQIVQIKEFLNKLPKKLTSDSEMVALSRKMRKLEEGLNIRDITKRIEENSPAKELKVSDRVLIKNRATGSLREGIIYANVSDSVPGNQSSNSHYCIKFTKTSSGESMMGYENYIKRSEIYLASGCGDKFCVGQEVIEAKTQDRFKVIGIDANGDYAIKSGEREMVGIQDRDLSKVK